MRFSPQPFPLFALLVGCAPLEVTTPPASPSDGAPLCRANADGRIEESELPFVVGVEARVRIGRDRAVDVSGRPGQGSARVWDLSRPDPADDTSATLVAESMTGKWFADRFPAAQFAGPLVPDNALLAPLVIDEDGVKLLGSASRDPDPPEGRTLLAYDTPVTLQPFPLTLGAHADTTTRATNGLLFGVPMALEDDYSVDVTAHGRVILPELILEDALRVTVRLRRVPLVGAAVQQVTHVFVNECLGEVARFVSPPVPLTEELPDEFPIAKEVWRLAL
jgi:hypothetical protein